MSRHKTSKTVLIVEDDPLIRDMAVVLLEELGYRIMEAGNVQEALRHLKASADQVGILFTDIQMPGPLDGMTLAHAVDLSWPAIMLLVTSGGVRPTGDDLPAKACFLPKPWRAVDLINMVETLSPA